MTNKEIIIAVIIILLLGIVLSGLISANIYNWYMKNIVPDNNPILPDNIQYIRTNIHGAEYSISVKEREIMARLVYLEAGACGNTCQRAVASVILNRLHSGYWGDNIESVIYYKNAFSPADQIKNCVPSEQSYAAVDYVLYYGSTLPKEVRYFRDDYDHQWEGYKNYAIYDNIYFGYFTNGDH